MILTAATASGMMPAAFVITGASVDVVRTKRDGFEALPNTKQREHCLQSKAAYLQVGRTIVNNGNQGGNNVVHELDAGSWVI